MKRALIAVATMATVLVTAAPAQAEPAGILETGCFPSAPSTTVNPEKTKAEVKLTITCKLAGVTIVKFEISSATKGKECTEPDLSYGQGSGLASLKADSSSTCKLDENGKGGVSFSQKLFDPLGLLVTEFSTGTDVTGNAGANLASETHSDFEASAGPLAKPEQSYNGNMNGNNNYGSGDGNLNGNNNWGWSNSGDDNGNGNGHLNHNTDGSVTNGNNNVGNYNGNNNGNWNY